jgi:acyl-CoA thioester hydrolase
MRWADLDQQGHINNVVYVDYLQEARVDLLRAQGRGPGLAEALVVVRHEVTYLKPLLYDFSAVSIECWVTSIRPATFTMAYEVFLDRPDGERAVFLRAWTVLTPYVFAEERPRRLTAEEREILTAFLEPDDRPRSRAQRLPQGAPLNHYPVHVRFSDVDVYGHVNNVKYFEYLQESRITMVRDLVEGGLAFHVVVAQTDVDYVRPILFRAEPYDCRSAITRLGSRSMTVESEIADGETVLARAKVVVVFFDLTTNRSTEPPASARGQLMAAVASGG